MNKKFFLIVLLIGAALFAAFRTSTAQAEVYNSGIVYVIYNKTGEHAVPNVDDNNNGVPDMVENVATQINAAREVFHDVYNFPDPLKSARYDGIKNIEVVIVSHDSLKHNGLAFSGANNKSRRNPKERVLLIKVASNLKTTNPTPLHEYFHLIQYGVTRFGNGWFLEGMANWSQDAVQKMKSYPNTDIAKKLDDQKYVDDIYKSKYEESSKLLWYPLAVEFDDRAEIPREIVKKYRYVDGSPVFKDNVIYGPNVIRDILITMPKREAEAVRAFGDSDNWYKKSNRSKENDPLILESVREYVNEHRHDN